MAQSRAINSAKVVFNPKDQKVEAIHRILGTVLGRAGCLGCGRLAVLEVQFAVDPAPEVGAISVTTAE
jgi:hypothetical protein